MPALKVRDGTILAAIDAYQRINGYAPTYRELCDLVGLASVSSVSHHLLTLELKGHITSVPNRPRTLRITDAGYESITAYSEA